MKLIFSLVIVFTFFVNSKAQLKLYETDNMKMITYDFGHNYILNHASRCFQNTLNFHKSLFEYKPTEKVTVLIQDFGDYGNAGATAIPLNFISMGLSPFSYAFETSPAGERVFSMMNHELVHVVALDNSAKSDRFFQNMFKGKVHPTKDNPLSMFYSYLTNPRMYAPRWYHEGIAAYVETWMNGGIGLAIGSFDEMVFRTLVLENARIYDAQGLESEGVTSDFQGRSNSYLYGTRFMGYLSYTYGPDKIIEWVKRTEVSKAFFAAQFKNIFGIPISQGWDDWIKFEINWQNKNIASLRENKITESEPISNEDLGSISYAHYDKKRDQIYLAVNYPGHYPHLASIDLESGKSKNLTDIKGPALFYVSSVTYDEQGDLLYFTSDNNAWRDLMQYDLNTGETKMMQENSRTGDLTFNINDKSIWGIKHLNGISTIVRIPEKSENKTAYSTWSQMYTLPYGQDIFDIDISPNGKLLSAAVSDFKGDQSLLLFDLNKLENKEVVVDTIFNFEVSSPQGFRFTKDGKYLIGSSYYSGVSNIFRVDVETKEIKAMSNALTGFFRPIEIDEERLLVFKFTSDGFKPVTIKNETVSAVSSIDFLGNITVEKYPELIQWELPIATSQDIDLDDYNLKETTYKPYSELSLNYAYPTIVGYKNVFGLGYKFNISDPIKFKELNFNFSYTPRSWKNHISSLPDTIEPLDASERFHFAFSARSGNITLSGSYNEASFYDLFGPRVTSRKGINGSLDYEKSLIWDLPRKLDLNLSVSGYYGLDRSPEFQQIETKAFDNSFFMQARGSLSFSHLKKSLGGVEHEKGVKSNINLAITQSSGDFFPNINGALDYGLQLPLAHSSIWFRSSAGNSFKKEFNPFSRFGFASFGNNYVDYHEFRQFRNPYSFAGLSFTNEFNIIAKEYAKVTTEWVLPPIRYRKFGGFNFFANWTQATIFTSFLTANDPDFGNNQYYNIGTQIDTRMVMFSHLPATLSIGYARAWQLDSNRNFGEFMISLKLLD
jgi:hypothetical protein